MVPDRTGLLFNTFITASAVTLVPGSPAIVAEPVRLAALPCKMSLCVSLDGSVPAPSGGAGSMLPLSDQGYNPPSATCGAKLSHLIVPMTATPLAALASTVNVPPLPDFSNVTLPDPLVAPAPRTVLI
jgi:hypothetical protein